MATQVWCRNPHDYIREMVEVQHRLVVWDRGMLIKQNIDARRHAELYFGADVPWRALVVGNRYQGAYEVGPSSPASRPSAVFPVWEYGDELSTLEDLLENPVGENADACSVEGVDPFERPILGQEHRVIITELPPISSGPGRRILTILRDLQEDHPEAIIHLHGLYSWRAMFGHNFRSADIEPRVTAKKGKVMLPMGKEMTYEKATEYPQWITLCGYAPVDLKVPRNRCMYNIRSARWAAKNFNVNTKFKTKGRIDPQVDVPDAEAQSAEVSKHRNGHSAALESTDKFLCNTCSIQTTCKYYREGSVCSVPETEPAKLAQFFKTRDSNQIVEGLGTLLASQANRLERGMQEEEFSDELDPEVSKMINSLFANGVKLAKLVNPDLAGGTKVGVFVNGHGAQVGAASSAQQLTAAIVAELEAKGIPRDEITPEMIAKVMDPDAQERAAIEARATVEARED